MVSAVAACRSCGKAQEHRTDPVSVPTIIYACVYLIIAQVGRLPLSQLLGLPRILRLSRAVLPDTKLPCHGKETQRIASAAHAGCQALAAGPCDCQCIQGTQGETSGVCRGGSTSASTSAVWALS